MRLVIRLAIAAAVTGLAILGGYRLLAGDDGTGGSPSPAAASPTDGIALDGLPDRFEASRWELNLGGHQTNVVIQLPVDGSLTAQPPSPGWRLDISHRTEDAESWGILVADVTGATNHVTRGGQDPVAGRDAASFLASLNATDSYVLGRVIVSEIDGRPALETTIRQALDGDPHLDVDGEGGIGFDRPNRVWLTLVDEHLIMVQAWAATDGDLGANLILARHIVESMRLTPA